MDDNHHDTLTKKKKSREKNDEMIRGCTADSREICRTCRLRVVEAKEMGIECYVCNRWSHAKCEKIIKEEFNVLGKKNPHLDGCVKLAETKTLVQKLKDCWWQW